MPNSSLRIRWAWSFAKSVRVEFALVAEGPSDHALLRPLRDLCLQCGVSEALGSAPDLRRLPSPIGARVADKLRAVTKLLPDVDLYLVHRDADTRDPAPRYREIEAAANEVSEDLSWVGVVPVRETEAWALLDERAIRAVAENPHGRNRLGLPGARAVERLADPKRRLDDAIVRASELNGRRLREFRRTLPWRRSLLLERIDLDGAIRQVPAWQRLHRELRAAIWRL